MIIRGKVVLMLAVTLATQRPAVARAQSADAFVRVSLVGPRNVEDSLVRWTNDSLFLRHTGPIARERVTAINVWAPRSFGRTWFITANLGFSAALLGDLIARPHHDPGRTGQTLALYAAGGVVFGFGVAMTERLLHKGRWVPLELGGRDLGRRPGSPE